MVSLDACRLNPCSFAVSETNDRDQYDGRQSEHRKEAEAIPCAREPIETGSASPVYEPNPRFAEQGSEHDVSALRQSQRDGANDTTSETGTTAAWETSFGADEATNETTRRAL